MAFRPPALAYHPMAGALMETFTQEVLSDVGHPLLGFDHLLFVLAFRIAALFTGAPRLVPADHTDAMMAGCLMMSYVELLSAASSTVLLLGSEPG